MKADLCKHSSVSWSHVWPSEGGLITIWELNWKECLCWTSQFPHRAKSSEVIRTLTSDDTMHKVWEQSWPLSMTSKKEILPLDYRQCCSHIFKMHWCSEHKILFYLCQRYRQILCFYYSAITVILEGEEFMRHSVMQQHSVECGQSLNLCFESRLIHADIIIILLVMYIPSYWNWGDKKSFF